MLSPHPQYHELDKCLRNFTDLFFFLFLSYICFCIDYFWRKNLNLTICLLKQALTKHTGAGVQTY